MRSDEICSDLGGKEGKKSGELLSIGKLQNVNNVQKI